MVLGKTVGDIPHHFSICTFSNSNNELLHSSLPHIKIKHTDCSNCSGEPYHCTLLNLSKCIWKLPVPHLKHTEITSQIFTTARWSPVHTYNYTHPTCSLEQILFAIYTHTYIHTYISNVQNWQLCSVLHRGGMTWHHANWKALYKD